MLVSTCRCCCLLIGRKGRGETLYVSRQSIIIIIIIIMSGGGVKSAEIFFDSVTSSCRQVPEGKGMIFLPSFSY